MKIRIPLKVFAVITVVVFASCSKNDNPITPPPASGLPKVLVPLSIGNSWSYRVTTFDTTGPISWVDTLTFFIRTDTIVDGVRWYLQGYNGATVGQLGFRNDSIGFHETNFEGWNASYPFPTYKGQLFQNWIVESTDSLIITSLGELRCHVYKSYFYGYPYRVIFAPGIGNVHTDIVGRTWGGTVWLAQTTDLVAASIIDSTTTHKRKTSVITARPSVDNRRLLRITRKSTSRATLVVAEGDSIE